MTRSRTHVWSALPLWTQGRCWWWVSMGRCPPLRSLRQMTWCRSRQRRTQTQNPTRWLRKVTFELSPDRRSSSGSTRRRAKAHIFNILLFYMVNKRGCMYNLSVERHGWLQLRKCYKCTDVFHHVTLSCGSFSNEQISGTNEPTWRRVVMVTMSTSNRGLLRDNATETLKMCLDLFSPWRMHCVFQVN